MKQVVYGWRTSEDSDNALWAVFNGREADFVPVAPLFVDSPFRGYVEERLYGMWEGEVAASGGDRVAVDFETYSRFRFEVMCEVIDRFHSPPCWVRFPWNAFRSEVEGCHVARRGKGLVWVARDGGEAPLVECLRKLDRRPGPWPMEHPVHRPLEEVEEILDRDPQSLLQPRSLGDQGSRWESASEDDLRAEGCLDVWDGLKDRYQRAMPSYTTGACPTQFAMDAMGFESLMLAFIQAPEIARRIFRLGMPRSRTHWQAVRDAGVDIVHVSEYSWGNQISADMYREFIMPYTREMLEFYRDIGFKVLLYVMGDIRPVLDLIAEQPFDALAIEEGRKGYELDVGEIFPRLPKDRVLFGNVPCELVAKGQPEDILAEVRRQVSVTGGERFVVSIGEPLPPGTPPERVRFFCDSTRLI
jgi:hypothetical protein